MSNGVHVLVSQSTNRQLILSFICVLREHFSYFVLFYFKDGSKNKKKLSEKKVTSRHSIYPFFLLDFIRNMCTDSSWSSSSNSSNLLITWDNKKKPPQTKAERHFRTFRPSLPDSFDLRAFANFHWHTLKMYFKLNDNYITF